MIKLARNLSNKRGRGLILTIKMVVVREGKKTMGGTLRTTTGRGEISRSGSARGGTRSTSGAHTTSMTASTRDMSRNSSASRRSSTDESKRPELGRPLSLRMFKLRRP